MVVLLQQSVPQTYATCFSKSISLLKKRRSATLLSSGPSTCAKTSLNTADQPLWIQQTIFLKNAFVCLRKSGGIYSGRMKTNGVFLLQDSFTLPYLSGLIWINPKSKEKNKGFGNYSGLWISCQTFGFVVFFGFFWFRQRADTCPNCHSVAKSWDNRSNPNCRQFTKWLLIWQMMR